jgi:hypothetical protein
MVKKIVILEDEKAQEKSSASISGNKGFLTSIVVKRNVFVEKMVEVLSHMISNDVICKYGGF